MLGSDYLHVFAYVLSRVALTGRQKSMVLHKTALSRLLGFRRLNVLKFLNTNVVATFLGGGGNEFEDVRKEVTLF